MPDSRLRPTSQAHDPHDRCDPTVLPCSGVRSECLQDRAHLVAILPYAVPRACARTSEKNAARSRFGINRSSELPRGQDACLLPSVKRPSLSKDARIAEARRTGQTLGQPPIGGVRVCPIFVWVSVCTLSECPIEDGRADFIAHFDPPLRRRTVAR